LDASNYNQVVILVKNNPAGTPATLQASSTLPATNAASSLLLMEFLGKHIYGYEPIYFLLGQYPGAEFQFSLKYKLFDLTGDWNPLAHSYFAYTQTSFWDLFSRDPSFYDTSYKPSAFLFYPDIFQKDRFQLDLQGGYEHESNGRGGSMERSLNTIYLQPTARFDLPAHFQLTFQTRAWYYLTLGNNNPDLPDYRGYADLLGALAWTNPQGGEKIQFATRLRIGDEGSRIVPISTRPFNCNTLPATARPCVNTTRPVTPFAPVCASGIDAVPWPECLMAGAARSVFAIHQFISSQKPIHHLLPRP
jgi:hypothetical protein